MSEMYFEDHPTDPDKVIIRKHPRLDQGPDYERGFIDGMQEQMRRSVDRAVNAMANQECPDCEYHKARAARWRAEAYKQAGHDVIELPWVGLTDAQFLEAAQIAERGNYLVAFQRIQASLKENNT